MMCGRGDEGEEREGDGGLVGNARGQPLCSRLVGLAVWVSGVGVQEEVTESQIPHQIVNLLFTITQPNNKVTVLWGS